MMPIPVNRNKGLLDGFLEDACGQQQHRDGQKNHRREGDINPQHGADDDSQFEDIPYRIQQAI
jgi:hypothetical protein